MSQMLHSGTACLAMLALASTVAYAAENSSKNDGGRSANGGEPAKLSVPPLDHIVLPKDRPRWIDETPDVDSHRRVVVTSPCETNEKCEAELDVLSRAAISSYVRLLTQNDQFDFLDSKFAQRIDSKANDSNDSNDSSETYSTTDEVDSKRLWINQWIAENLVTRAYAGSVRQSDDEMREKAIELTFSPEIQTEIVQAAQQEEVSQKLQKIAALTFVGTTLLICCSMFLCMLSRRAERRDAAVVAL